MIALGTPTLKFCPQNTDESAATAAPASSPVANRRAFLVAADALARASAPTPQQILAVTNALGQVITDLVNERVRVELVFPEQPPKPLEGQLSLVDQLEGEQ